MIQVPIPTTGGDGAQGLEIEKKTQDLGWALSSGQFGLDRLEKLSGHSQNNLVPQ